MAVKPGWLVLDYMKAFTLALAWFLFLGVPNGWAAKKVVFIAGARSHGWFAHDHKAGCYLLAKALNQSGLDLHAEVSYPGWPRDPSVLKDADTLVVYADGAAGNPLNRDPGLVDQLMKRGVGLVCIHFAVETPKGVPGNHFLDWLGGYFEVNWSVNPHWTAAFDTLPDHPITRGVQPFSIRDEWYYHMRFRKGMKGVTPILTDLPPAETLTKRGQGSRSSNPYVRAAVIERKEPQILAWATERDDGGRAFGLTGGHNHVNWVQRDFRTLVLNAIVWTARLEVPRGGVPSANPTFEAMTLNMDDPRPNPWKQAAQVRALVARWRRERP